MNKTDKAKEIISLIEGGASVDSIKPKMEIIDDAKWVSYANIAYNLKLEEAKKEREQLLKQPHTCGASNTDIDELLVLNVKLCDYALSVPYCVSQKDLRCLKNFQNNTPNSKFDNLVNNMSDKEAYHAAQFSIINILEKIIFDTQIRALQKKGRFEQFEPFKIFSERIHAATISYYQANFISCYLTLVPVIEGIIVRWAKENGKNYQCDFEKLRKFFKNSPLRQPCPHNIQFHKVYVDVCDKILNEHFYKPTDKGDAFAYFNRHIALHSLEDEECGTRDNCIRIFLLLDTMAEVYKLEHRIKKCPRTHLTDDDISNDVLCYNLTQLNRSRFIEEFQNNLL